MGAVVSPLIIETNTQEINQNLSRNTILLSHKTLISICIHSVSLTEFRVRVPCGTGSHEPGKSAWLGVPLMAGEILTEWPSRSPPEKPCTEQLFVLYLGLSKKTFCFPMIYAINAQAMNSHSMASVSACLVDAPFCGLAGDAFRPKASFHALYLKFDRSFSDKMH